MKCLHWVVAVMSLPLLSGADAPSGDLSKLQGTWTTVSIVDEGKLVFDEKHPPGAGPTAKLEYQGTNWMVKVGEKTVATGVFKSDPAKGPKELDVMDESGTRNDKTKLAIYELDGDTFRYCIARTGQARPTEFKSVAGSGHSLITSRREKP